MAQSNKSTQAQDGISHATCDLVDDEVINLTDVLSICSINLGPLNVGFVGLTRPLQGVFLASENSVARQSSIYRRRHRFKQPPAPIPWRKPVSEGEVGKDEDNEAAN
jgi:hypothetical protein